MVLCTILFHSHIHEVRHRSRSHSMSGSSSRIRGYGRGLGGRGGTTADEGAYGGRRVRPRVAGATAHDIYVDEFGADQLDGDDGVWLSL